MKTRRLPIIVVTVFFAILVWGSVKLGYQYQTVVSAPIVIEQLPPGKAIRTPLPRVLQLRFRGDGWQLVSLLLGTDLTYPIDARNASVTARTVTVRTVGERLSFPAGLQIMEMTPESLTVELDTYAERTIPVALDARIGFRDGYGRVGDPVITPDTVRVGGAESVLATIDSLPTEPLEPGNINAPIDQELALHSMGPYRFTIVPHTVHVHIDVQAFAERIVPGIAVEILAEPPNRELILIPPRMDIVVRGGIGQLAPLVQSDFRATVSYYDVLSDSSGLIDVHVAVPQGLQIVKKQPERLQYVVRKRL